MEQEIKIENYKQQVFLSSLIQYFENPYRSFDQQFASKAINVILKNKQFYNIFQTHLSYFLRSKKTCIEVFFHKIIQLQQFEPFIWPFLKSILDQNDNISFSLEVYIIQNIWKDSIRTIYTNHNVNILQLISYLCMKMRSLFLPTRKAALSSFCQYSKTFLINENQNNQSEVSIKKLLPSMIQKQILVKKVSHTKGIFLQILEDECHQIRLKCIECLGLLHKYFDLNQLKSIILYMVHDEHELVRQKALETITKIPGFYLMKQQLGTLFMCLKENNIILRNLVYQTLLHCEILEECDIMLTINRLLDNLLTHKLDKKKIYGIFQELGRKYPAMISRQIDNLLPNSECQPNWKNIQHKAKIILLGNMGLQWRKKVPQYFNKHYLYVKDVEAEAFRNNNRQMLNQMQIQEEFLSFSSLTNIIQFIQCQINLSQGLKLNILQIIKEAILKTSQINKIIAKVQQLQYQYQIQQNLQINTLIAEIENLFKQTNFPSIIQITNLLKSIVNKKWIVNKNTIKFSKYDARVLIVSKTNNFIRKCFVKCNDKKKAYYIRLSSMEPFSIDVSNCYYHINLNPSLLECVIQEDCHQNEIYKKQSIDNQSKKSQNNFSMHNEIN